jgi:Fur family ferric uptake transcriptional regulator
MMREEEKKFSAFLKENNLKTTPERMAVLKAVLLSDGHFDADQLFERAQKYSRRVSRATIYRVLPLLVEAGFVSETLLSQGRVSYERVYGSQRHDHMICDDCQEVIEFRSARLDDLVEEISSLRGFVESEHRLSVRGLCRKCAAKIVQGD